MTFLRYSKNKADLFPYWSNAVLKEIQDEVVVSTVNENVVTNGAGLEISSLMQCNMEEPDERIFVHAKHASREYTCIMIKTFDSDIVIRAIANFHQLVPWNELQIEFVAGTSLRFIPIHQIARSLGLDKSRAFLFFHAFSGCDMMPSLSGKDKKSFFDTWASMDEITPLFKKLSSIETTEEISDDEYLSSLW